jgi:hypothetical protein
MRPENTFENVFNEKKWENIEKMKKKFKFLLKIEIKNI